MGKTDKASGQLAGSKQQLSWHPYGGYDIRGFFGVKSERVTAEDKVTTVDGELREPTPNDIGESKTEDVDGDYCVEIEYTPPVPELVDLSNDDFAVEPEPLTDEEVETLRQNVFTQRRLAHKQHLQRAILTDLYYHPLKMMNDCGSRDEMLNTSARLNALDRNAITEILVGAAKEAEKARLATRRTIRPLFHVLRRSFLPSVEPLPLTNMDESHARAIKGTKVDEMMKTNTSGVREDLAYTDGLKYYAAIGRARAKTQRHYCEKCRRAVYAEVCKGDSKPSHRNCQYERRVPRRQIVADLTRQLDAATKYAAEQTRLLRCAELGCVKLLASAMHKVAHSIKAELWDVEYMVTLLFDKFTDVWNLRKICANLERAYDDEIFNADKKYAGLCDKERQLCSRLRESLKAHSANRLSAKETPTVTGSPFTIQRVEISADIVRHEDVATFLRASGKRSLNQLSCKSMRKELNSMYFAYTAKCNNKKYQIYWASRFKLPDCDPVREVPLNVDYGYDEVTGRCACAPL